ncbi:MAG TPA: Hsp20/alpha crystallin family protein [Vicinamibacterales bacterium]
MAFAHWDPFRDLLALQERLDALAGERAAGWAPPVDLFETADHYQIIAEVPGLTREQIRVQVQNGILTIEGERSVACLPCEQHHRVERGHGRFARSFQLHEPIDSDAVDADLRDGILTIKLLKRAQEARRIPVR